MAAFPPTFLNKLGWPDERGAYARCNNAVKALQLSSVTHAIDSVFNLQLASLASIQKKLVGSGFSFFQEYPESAETIFNNFNFTLCNSSVTIINRHLLLVEQIQILLTSRSTDLMD